MNSLFHHTSSHVTLSLRGDTALRETSGLLPNLAFAVSLILVILCLVGLSVCGAEVPGLDVSHYQGGINWASVYAAGYRFVFVKASGGDEDPPTIVDPNFETNMIGARNAGLLAGAYHFAYPYYNEADSEARHFLNVAGDYITEGYLRPALDVETGGGTLTDQELSSWIETWMTTVETATGVEPLLYVNSNYANYYLESWVNKYDLWIAHWRCSTSISPNTGIWNGEWAFWQYYGPSYCGDNYVPGISGNVDLDVFNGTRTELDAFAIGGGADLIVEDIWIDPAEFGPGDTVDLCVRIGNIGDAAADGFVLKRYLDGDYVAPSYGAEGLGADYSTTLPTSWELTWPSNYNSYAVKVIIDADGDVPESDEGNNERSETFSATEDSGSLRVTISPQGAIDAGARWRVTDSNDDTSGWYNSGYTKSDLPVGSYTVEYNDISGWTKPTDDTGTIQKDQTVYESGTYTEDSGSLRVTISPQGAIDAGARWRVTDSNDDTSGWYNSGYTKSDLPVGSYTVEYNDISGWTKPTDDTGTIQKDQTVYEDGTYVARTITVTSPNGGEGWEVGSNHNITWTSQSAGSYVKIEYSANGASSWSTIVGSTANDGSRPWTIPDNPSTNCQVKVTSISYPSVFDISDGDFTIYLDTVAVFRVDDAGNVLADGPFYGSGFYSGSADVAEWVSVSEPVEPGDVLELDPDNPGHYRKPQTACSSLVAGVVSTDPGFVLGSKVQGSAIGVSGVTDGSGLMTDDSQLSTPDRALLALIGIVPVKVTDEGGPINPGDLLVSSSTSGYAMRWDGDREDEKVCGLIGKALDPFQRGTGVIQVLLMR